MHHPIYLVISCVTHYTAIHMLPADQKTIASSFFNTNTEAKQHIESCSENRTERSIRWQSFAWTALVAIGIDGGFAMSIKKR